MNDHTQYVRLVHRAASVVAGHRSLDSDPSVRASRPTGQATGRQGTQAGWEKGDGGGIGRAGEEREGKGLGNRLTEGDTRTLMYKRKLSSRDLFEETLRKT